MKQARIHFFFSNCYDMTIVIPVYSFAKTKNMWFVNIDEFPKSHQNGWLSKNRQMQGARISRNEAYLGTPQ